MQVAPLFAAALALLLTAPLAHALDIPTPDEARKILDAERAAGARAGAEAEKRQTQAQRRQAEAQRRRADQAERQRQEAERKRQEAEDQRRQAEKDKAALEARIRQLEAAQAKPAAPPPAPVAKPAAPAPAPALIAGRYQPLAGGSEIKDMQTGLVWARCSVGQNWTGSTCAGEAKTFKFDDAQKQASQGWRVPTVRELHSLVWCSSGKTKYSADVGDGQPALKYWCDGQFERPTIRQEAFPQTPTFGYWSSSPYAGDSGSAWGVYFDYGYVYYGSRGYGYAVRLVRASQ